MDFTPDQYRLMTIFFPHAAEKTVSMRETGRRFVHYTSAEAAMNILSSKSVWMRKTSCMADFTEVEHGLNNLDEAYGGEAGTSLVNVLNSLFDGISADIEELFKGWRPTLSTDTYITCFSEHHDSEDNTGRLSMWRAFSRTTGVAFVFNTAPFVNPSDALKAYTSPVSYEAHEKDLVKIAENIKESVEFLREQGRETIVGYVFNAFKFGALCSKHPGFKEEVEWRIIYTPSMEKSPYLVKDIQVIGGIPQQIYKIPLQNFPDEGLVGAEIPELIDRIIIGPTAYPSAVREAFEGLLEDAGVSEPRRLICVSDLPIRM